MIGAGVVQQEKNYSRALVAANLRAARKAMNITQVELAKASGVSQQTISQIEQEHVSASVDTLGRFALAMHVPLETFFKERSGGC